MPRLKFEDPAHLGAVRRSQKRWWRRKATSVKKYSFLLVFVAIGKHFIVVGCIFGSGIRSQLQLAGPDGIVFNRSGEDSNEKGGLESLIKEGY